MDWNKYNPPEETCQILRECPKLTVFSTTDELIDSACNGPKTNHFKVEYEVPGHGTVLEAEVCRVRNGISANFPEAYMRRRDPDSMVIADEKPTDKPTFRERFGDDFSLLRGETFDWLKQQPLGLFGFFAGQEDMGLECLAIVPDNAGFFALGLALMQGIIPYDQIASDFKPQSVIYVAPPFRHTHFDGKQVVVHNRRDDLHELFSYNLYPGPSAKKGVYGMLIGQGEREGWVTAHCSAVRVITPYDNAITIMHEGASGGGKSEMLEQAHREADGRLLLGENSITRERSYLEIPRSCELHPVIDDMALCHPSIQPEEKKLAITDAEDAWFVRVNHIDHYGTDVHFERLTAEPPHPLLFLNIDAVPGSRALIWEHMMDNPNKACPNPRVILPRRIVPRIVNEPVIVDIRSIGVRTPPCTKEKPTYGIIGLFHLLPPALAWLWRLVAPRGHANPSIVDTDGMSSEGVGSYWPFATGRRVDQANLLLSQFRSHTRMRYILIPNQFIGAWKVGFMAEWIARDYLARRGSARYKPHQIMRSRCPLLGYNLREVHVEGRVIMSSFLQVETQAEVGEHGYDEGTKILLNFFRDCLVKFIQPDLDPLGKRIIECCLDNGNAADYEKLIPST